VQYRKQLNDFLDSPIGKSFAVSKFALFYQYITQPYLILLLISSGYGCLDAFLHLVRTLWLAFSHSHNRNMGTSICWASSHWNIGQLLSYQGTHPIPLFSICVCYFVVYSNSNSNWTGILSGLQDAIYWVQEPSNSMYRLWQHCVAT